MLNKCIGRTYYNSAVKDTALLVIYGIHDRSRGVISRLQKRLSGTVYDRVVGIDIAGHKFLHDELNTFEVLIMETAQLVIIV